MKILHCAAACLALIWSNAGAAQTSATNTTGKPANDLHIVTSLPITCFIGISIVPCNPVSDQWGPSGSPDIDGDGNFVYTFKGAAIGAGGTFSMPGRAFAMGTSSNIVSSYWTDGGVNIGPVTWMSPSLPGPMDADALRRGGWSITAIPEPMSWTLMIAGFALCGGALRRHRPAFG